MIENWEDINKFIAMVTDILWLVIGFYFLIYLRKQIKDIITRLSSSDKVEISMKPGELKLRYEGLAETAA